MLNFKEYTLMSFQNLFEERFKNHFLKEARQNLFKFNFSSGFLSSLTKDGNNSEAIKYFVNLIETEEPYTSLFNSFLTDSESKKYYRFACYYMKESNLPNGISQLDNKITKEKNADIALKEVFANELYKHLSILTLSKTQPEQKNIIQQTKENISKAFVPDAVTHIAVSAVSTLFDWPTISYLLKGKSHTGGFQGFKTDFGYSVFINPFSSFYNDRTISFQNRIFNEDEFNNTITTLLDDKKTFTEPFDFGKFYAETTKETNHSILLDAGAYIEYYFKFDYSLLLKYKPYATPDGNGLTQYYKWGLNKKNYYSFREITLLLSILRIIVDQHNFNPSNKSLLSKEEILDKLNLKFGARLVVKAPFLDNFISKKIKFGNTNKLYESSLKVNTPSTGPLTANIYSLIEDTEEYASKNIKSCYKNKTFVYNLIEQDFTSSGDLNENASCSVEQYETFPMAEYEISLSKEQVTKILVSSHANTATGEGWAATWRNSYDFLVDKQIISLFSKKILDELFNIQIVKEYFLSKTNSLEEVTSAVISNEKIYNEATKDTILSSGTTPEKFIKDANKMDDIIDQNLITLISSIEVS
jgi:hypothetical protein